MHGQRIRKRREMRTVDLSRGRSGFGFTITGELPCRLGGVVPGSAADCVGLQSGDRLIGINGHDVSMLSHDEVVRRIGSCRNVLRLNVAEHSSEDSSADSSDNAEMYVGRLVNNGLHSRPVAIGSANQQSVDTMEVGQNRHKYGRHAHRSHPERYRAHAVGSSGSDRHVSMRNSHGRFDLHHCNESPCGMTRRRKTKHTVITREARIGIGLPERRPQSSDRYSHNICDDSDNDDISLSSSELQVVVGYSGSVEMPSDAPRLAGSRLQSIRGAVNRLRATNRARSLVVMDIGADGVRLTDAMCRVVACYVTSRIAFCGICPDDRRFFGIVMTSGEAANSSCHVFMVDPEIAEHHLHAGIAARFGLNCTMDLDTPRCLEFPLSAVPIISFLGQLYRHRKNTASFVPLTGNFSNSNVRGICDGKSQDDRVYVVDVLNDNNDQRSCADGIAVPPVSQDENELFIHNLSVIEPVLGDEPLQSRKPDEQKCLGRGRLMTRSLSQASSILRESNRHVPSSGLRRVTTTLDDNSFRQSLHQMPPYAVHAQPLRHCATDDDSDADSSCSVQDARHSGSTSPVPPPIPPKLCVSKYHSNARLAANKPLRSSALGAQVGLTPVWRTPRGNGRPVPVPQSCSASKPPLPERRPTSTRSVQKTTASSLKQDVSDRPKSTPPVNRMTLATPAETMNYDSDPGEGANEETCKQQYIMCQSDDNDVIKSPEDLEVHTAAQAAGMQLAASCKQLTAVGGEQKCLGRVAGWAVHFDRLLADPIGHAAFAEFLQTEFSGENLLFWTKCEEYKQLTDINQRKLAAAELIAGHFADGARDPINVEGTVRQAVMDAATSATVNLFDAAQKQIYLLMKHDSFARFLKSDMYKQALIGEMEGRSIPYTGLSGSHSKIKAAGRKKMKKSRSIAAASDEKRRKSLLPWGRNKNEKKFAKVSASEDTQRVQGGISSPSGSSSLSENVDSESAEQSCLVVLPDGSDVRLQVSSGRSVGSVLEKLNSRLQCGLEFLDVNIADTNECVSLTDDVVQLVSKRLHLERCTVFRLDIPGRRVMAVRARVSHRLDDVVSPILARAGISYDDVVIHIAGTGVILSEDTSIAALECKHVIIQSLDEVKGKKRKDGLLSSGKLSASKQKSPVSLANTTSMSQLLKTMFGGICDSRVNFDNIVFDDLGVWTPDRTDSTKARIEDGRHSNLFSFIRRSSLGDKKPLPNAATHAQQMTTSNESIPVAPSVHSRQNNDERRLIDLLKRVQNRQYDDQRGTSLTAFKEMPDFLRESNDDDVERMIADEEFSEKCALDDSRVEVSRHRDTDTDSGFHLSPAQCLQQTDGFSDEDEIPSHENAERYFSCSGRTLSSPDFNDPKLMECSVRDIGMESPISVNRTWTLVGNIADNPCTSPANQVNDDFVFAVPSMPPLRVYRRRVSGPLLSTAMDSLGLECVSQKQSTADPGHKPLSVDTSVVHNEASSSNTPSPTTHDLVVNGGDCIVSKSDQVCSTVHHALAPIVDSEDSGEEFGIV